MKNRKLLFWMLISFIIGTAGCKKLDFNYKQFIGDGEITYVGKADSLLLKGGDRRAEISFLLISDPTVSAYKLYWNNKQDSTSGSLNKTAGIDTVRLMINNLEEQTHEFQVFLFDDKGNSSVMSSTVGRVYGEFYKKTLINRLFKTLRVISGNQVEIAWASPEASLLRSEIKYVNTNSELITHITKPATEHDTLFNFPVGGDFELRSAFLPDSLALDTFYTKYEKINVP